MFLDDQNVTQRLWRLQSIACFQRAHVDYYTAQTISLNTHREIPQNKQHVKYMLSIKYSLT